MWHCLLHTKYISECHACVFAKASHLVFDLRKENKRLTSLLSAAKEALEESIEELEYDSSNGPLVKERLKYALSKLGEEEKEKK